MLDKQKNRGTLQPYLRNVNVRWFSFDLDDLKEMHFEDGEAARYELQPGDLVICEGGEPGRAAVWRGSAHNARIQKALHRVRFHPDEYNPSFAMYYMYFAAITNRLTPHYTGTTIKHLTGAALAKVRFPIPPLSEQRRIVAKIEELFSDLDAGVVALERVRANLKRYRVTVLKAAVEGTLTEDWRAQHPDTEPASVLLERILTERRRKWEQAQLAKFAQEGKKPPKGWRDKYRELLSPQTSELPPLPTTWCWGSLEQIAEIEGGITKDQNRRLTATMRDVPYLRVANVQRGYLDLREIKSILAELDVIDNLRLCKGDILFTEGGDRDKLGRGWVWNNEIEECIHQNHVFRARLLAPCLEPKFVSYHGNYFGQQWFTRTGKQTTNLASINKGILSRFPIPVPPTAEGAQIVSEVERRLSIVDEIEAQVDTNLRRAARLRQGILKRAFEGRLVPQDPTDEPAEKLLEHIRQQRQATNAPRNASRHRRNERRP